MEQLNGLQERRLSSLFLLALLSNKKNIGDPVKWAAVRNAPHFNIHNHSNVHEALLETVDKIESLDRDAILLTRQYWSRASEVAEKWFADGVFILPDELYRPPKKRLSLGGRILLAAGNPNVWSDSRPAILCSRQPRTINPNSPFLQTITSVAPMAMATGCTIVSSYGTAGYNAVNCIAYGNSILIVCDGPLPHIRGLAALNKFLKAYDGLIDPGRSLFVSSFLPGANIPHKGIMVERDRLVSALATEIYAVSVRPGGNVHRIVSEAIKQGVPVSVFPARDSSDSRQTTRSSAGLQFCRARNHDGHSCHSHGAMTNPDPLDIQTKARENKRQQRLSEKTPPSRLYHYTRSCPGPWPAQSPGQYWRALIQRAPNAAHTALDTLCRILEEKLIRASGRFIRGKEPVVCFSELPPSRLPTLARWRRGLTRWSVEPYGIGIATDALQDLGARPVQYGMEDDLPGVPVGQRHLFQIQRSRSLVWLVEREWRIKGNVGLSLVPAESIVVVVADEREMETIKLRFGYRCIAAGNWDATMPKEKESWTSEVNKACMPLGMGEEASGRQQ